MLFVGGDSHFQKKRSSPHVPAPAHAHRLLHWAPSSCQPDWPPPSISGSWPHPPPQGSRPHPTTSQGGEGRGEVRLPTSPELRW